MPTPPSLGYLWILDNRHIVNTCCFSSKRDKDISKKKASGLHGDVMWFEKLNATGYSEEDKAVTAWVGETERGRGWWRFLSESLTGIRKKRDKMRRIRFGLSGWPSARLQFSWWYEQVVCERENLGFFKTFWWQSWASKHQLCHQRLCALNDRTTVCVCAETKDRQMLPEECVYRP